METIPHSITIQLKGNDNLIKQNKIKYPFLSLTLKMYQTVLICFIIDFPKMKPAGCFSKQRLSVKHKPNQKPFYRQIIKDCIRTFHIICQVILVISSLDSDEPCVNPIFWLAFNPESQSTSFRWPGPASLRRSGIVSKKKKKSEERKKKGGGEWGSSPHSSAR